MFKDGLTKIFNNQTDRTVCAVKSILVTVFLFEADDIDAADFAEKNYII